MLSVSTSACCGGQESRNFGKENKMRKGEGGREGEGEQRGGREGEGEQRGRRGEERRGKEWRGGRKKEKEKKR